MPDAPMIMVCMPSKGEIKTKTVECLVSTLGNLMKAGIRVKLTFAEGTLVTHVRNKLVEEFLKQPEFTHMMFIDSDMVFHPDWITKLIEHDKDMVCGVARTRGDIAYNIYTKDVISTMYRSHENIKERNDLIEIDATGMAFMLMKRKVVAMIREFNSIGVKSEDILWCEKGKELGFHIFCDLSMKLGHIVEMELKCDK